MALLLSLCGARACITSSTEFQKNYECIGLVHCHAIRVRTQQCWSMLCAGRIQMPVTLMKRQKTLYTCQDNADDFRFTTDI
jgi:hypothetical protein